MFNCASTSNINLKTFYYVAIKRQGHMESVMRSSVRPRKGIKKSARGTGTKTVWMSTLTGEMFGREKGKRCSVFAGGKTLQNEHWSRTRQVIFFKQLNKTSPEGIRHSRTRRCPNYRCFLPDLAGFAGPSCKRPDLGEKGKVFGNNCKQFIIFCRALN